METRNLKIQAGSQQNSLFPGNSSMSNNDHVGTAVQHSESKVDMRQFSPSLFPANGDTPQRQSAIVQELDNFNKQNHPTLLMSRQTTTDVERQNRNLQVELAEDVDKYLRELEVQNDVSNCLARHPTMNGPLRARMIDWMIEVLTNFKCDDQTFFLAVSLMDRYFKRCSEEKQVSELHLVGVTSMFLASKYEDIQPLKMKTVYEKIGHKKLDIAEIKKLELDMMKSIDYKIHAPTVLDFLKVYLVDVLGITIESRTETKRKEEAALRFSGHIKDDASSATGEPQAEKQNRLVFNEEQVQKYLIEKMAIYLAKMAMHHLDLCTHRPSLLAVGAIYVALKICEQLKKQVLITQPVVMQLIHVSKMPEEVILDVSQ